MDKNKKIMIGVAIIVIVLLIGYFTFNSDGFNSDSESSLDSIPASEFADIDSDSEVLNEIDVSLEELG